MTLELFGQEPVAGRVVSIPGARNLRDMGDYPTDDGRRVMRGMLFRGGHPGDIPAESVTELRRLGLRGHVDLRTTSERKTIAFPEDLVEAVGCWSRDYDHSGGEMMRLITDPRTTADDMRQRMIRSYQSFPDEQQEGIAATFRLILAGRLPLLINCSAGKDRTGVVCAMLLSALGVPHDIVRGDYALTETLQDPRAPLFRTDAGNHYAPLASVNPDVWEAMMRSSVDYIDATFEVLNRDHGGLQSYLTNRLGIDESDITAIRDKLLED